MPNETIPSKVFGGSGCASYPGVSFNVIRGSLSAGTGGVRLPSLGFPVEIDFSYDSGNSNDGMFGNVVANIDALGRRISTTLNNQATPVNQTAYAYDAMSRLSIVTRNAAALGGTTITTTYARVPGSSLLASTTLNDGTNDVLSTTRQYDALNRLTNISTSAQSVQSVDKSFTYTYNDNDQRVKCALASGDYWLYQYDDLGQVTSGKKFTATGQEIPGQQFSYSFDDIGNRLTSTNSPQVDYATNDLNQYVSRTVPGEFTLSGKTATDASAVAIQNEATGQAFRAERLENYFYIPQTVDNSDTSYLIDYRVTALDVDDQGQETYSTQNLDVFIPKNPEQFTYDADGNLTSDARWNYQWDAENRRKSQVTRNIWDHFGDIDYASLTEADLPDSAIAEKGDLVATCQYDYQSRRIAKKVWKFHVVPGEPGTGGEIPMIAQIREKLAETIAKIEADRDREIARIQRRIERIQNSHMPQRMKDRLIRQLERQIERETEKAERQIARETEKAEQRIAYILEHGEEMIAKLREKIADTEEWRDRHVECVQAIIDWLEEHRDELEGGHGGHGHGRNRGKHGTWGKKLNIFDFWKKACDHGHSRWRKRWKHGRKCGDLPLFPHFIGFTCGRNWDIDKLIELLQQKIALINELADRRIAKLQAKIDALTGGGSEPTEPVYEWRLTHQKFVYDANNVIAMYDVVTETDPDTGETVTNDVLSRTYLWGEDLSGSLQGAGGVGGLLAETVHSTDTEGNPVEKAYQPVYDGNGNVMAYVDAATGEEKAEFEYGPFGERKVDTDEEYQFPIRFSTKWYDKETDSSHYRFRELGHNVGRWKSRDPKNDLGVDVGIDPEIDYFPSCDVYVLNGNDSINRWDLLGLEWQYEFVTAGEPYNNGANEGGYGTIYAKNTEETDSLYQLAEHWTGDGMNQYLFKFVEGEPKVNPETGEVGAPDCKYDITPALPSWYKENIGNTGTANCHYSAIKYAGLDGYINKRIELVNTDTLTPTGLARITNTYTRTVGRANAKPGDIINYYYRGAWNHSDIYLEKDTNGNVYVFKKELGHPMFRLTTQAIIGVDSYHRKK